MKHLFFFSCLLLAHGMFLTEVAAAARVRTALSPVSGAMELQTDGDGDGVYASYVVKGVGYSPVPIGRSGFQWGVTNIFDDPLILERDFQVIADMGANTIRIWKANATNTSQNEFPNFMTERTLTMADEYGLKVIPGFWIAVEGYWQCGLNGREFVWDQSFFDLAGRQVWPEVRADILERWRAFILEFRDHPAVLFWAIGNENNYHIGHDPLILEDFYRLINEMAELAHTLDDRPVAFVNGDIVVTADVVDPAGGTAGEIDLFPQIVRETAAAVDIWGVNAYRGKSFGDLFSDFHAISGGTKPLWVAEYGIDAWHSDPADAEGGREDQDRHAEWITAQWQEIAGASSLGVIGATIMSYSDEWWKPDAWLCKKEGWEQWWRPYWMLLGGGVKDQCGVFNTTHDLYGFGPTDDNCDGIIDTEDDWIPSAPDQFFNEEWWGLVSVHPGFLPGFPDVVMPRKAYYALRHGFSGQANKAPVIEQVPQRTAAPGELVVVAITARDPDNDPVSFSARLATGEGIETIGAVLVDQGEGQAEFRWTPEARHVGTTRVVVSVHDVLGLTAETVITIVVGLPPKIISVTPLDAEAGDVITITGQYFGAYQAGSRYDPPVDFNADGVIDAGDSAIFMNAYGTVEGSSRFNPAVDLNRDGRVSVNDFYIFGAAYQARAGRDFVEFSDGRFARIKEWRDDRIICEIPTGARSGNLRVRTESGSSNGVAFTVGSAASRIQVVSLTPGLASAMTRVTIEGRGFGSFQGSYRYTSSYDLNRDTMINTTDMALFMSHYKSRRGEPRYSDEVDYDVDGDVDVQDFFIFGQGANAARGSAYVVLGGLWPRVVSWTWEKIVVEVPFNAFRLLGAGPIPVSIVTPSGSADAGQIRLQQ